MWVIVSTFNFSTKLFNYIYDRHIFILNMSVEPLIYPNGFTVWPDIFTANFVVIESCAACHRFILLQSFLNQNEFLQSLDKSPPRGKE